jgi:hypothetical protein
MATSIARPILTSSNIHPITAGATMTAAPLISTPNSLGVHSASGSSAAMNSIGIPR